MGVTESLPCVTLTKTVGEVEVSRTYCKQPDETEAAFGARAAAEFQAFCDGYEGG